MISGTITLVREADEVELRSRRYHSKSHRKSIIDGWKMYVSGKTKSCFMQALPDEENDLSTDKDGMNCRLNDLNNFKPKKKKFIREASSLIH